MGSIATSDVSIEVWFHIGDDGDGHSFGLIINFPENMEHIMRERDANQITKKHENLYINHIEKNDEVVDPISSD